MQPTAAALLAPLAALSLTATLLASEPRTWTLATYADFLKGRLEGISLTADGRLVPAPLLERRADTGQAYVFSMAHDPDGNVFLGTGNEGRIFRYRQGEELSAAARLPEVAVYAMAVSPTGTLYAASSPDGRVYEIRPGAEPRPFFEPKEKYIWALAFDPQGNLFVGTGPRGMVYRVARGGQGAEFYDSPETHITSLLAVGDEIVAGSAPGGHIYRISQAGRAFVIYDSPLAEIRSLAVDRTGMLYAAAVAAGEPAEGGQEEGRQPARSPLPPARPVPQDSDPPEDAPPSPAEGRRSEVYRIGRNGMVETILASAEDIFYCVVPRNDGSVLVGSGRRGRILSVDRARNAAILAQSPEEQITGLVEQGAGLIAATSGLGRVYELRADAAPDNRYESEVLDARFPSRWGLIRWRADAAAGAELFTRSGNTRMPDVTWSDWSGPYRDASGQAVQSPPARFLQWKLQFPSGSRPASVTAVSGGVSAVFVSYLQQNVAPEISAVNILSPGVAFQPFPGSPPGGAVLAGRDQSRSANPLSRFAREADSPSNRPPPRRVFIPGAQSLTWSARDENGDDLEYAIFVRGEAESAWRLLVEGLTEETYTFDSRMLAPGMYSLRVVASDLPSNPRPQALTDERISRPFAVAHAPPRVRLEPAEVQPDRIDLHFTAEADIAPLYQAEYSVNGGPWEIVYPADGITDGRREDFRISVPAGPGEHVLGIRVLDTAGNIGTAGTVVRK